MGIPIGVQQPDMLVGAGRCGVLLDPRAKALPVAWRIQGADDRVGQRVSVPDRSLKLETASRKKTDKSNPAHVGASMPGTVIAVHCKAGDSISEADPLLTLEAMKMETVVRAPTPGKVSEVACGVKDPVQADDLLVVLE